MSVDDPAALVEKVRSTGEQARRWLWVGAGTYAVQLLAAPVLYASVLDDLTRTFEVDPATGVVEPGQLESSSGWLSVVSGVSNLVGLAGLAVGVIFLVWVHAAATAGRRLGLPATHTPGWAVAGFIVPVVNLWFGYQAVRDALPPGDPARSLVGRWWALWLLTSFASLGVAVVVGLGGLGLGLVAALVAAGVAVAAAHAAREVVAAVTAAHQRLVGGW